MSVTKRIKAFLGLGTDGRAENDSTETEYTGYDVDVDPEYDEPDIEAEDLTDVKGVGPTRADKLRDNDFDTPEDLYFATDENIEAVDTFGPHVVSQIREDIGSVDGE
jgi:predicted flap endonuclease-1-like 5' DNA nuclease